MFLPARTINILLITFVNVDLDTLEIFMEYAFLLSILNAIQMKNGMELSAYVSIIANLIAHLAHFMTPILRHVDKTVDITKFGMDILVFVKEALLIIMESASHLVPLMQTMSMVFANAKMDILFKIINASLLLANLVKDGTKIFKNVYQFATQMSNG